jgi:hypothetical protein
MENGVTASSSELDKVKLIVQQKDNIIRLMKDRAKEFVAQMKGENERLKEQVLQLQQSQQKKDQIIDQYKQEKNLLQQQQQQQHIQPAGDSSSDLDKLSTMSHETSVIIERLNEEKKTLANDVESAKRDWCLERTKVEKLEQDLTKLLQSQQQSAEVMAAANTRSREHQEMLTKAEDKIQEQKSLIERLRAEVDNQIEVAQEASLELDRVTNQTSLQVGASQQVVKDLRAHIQTVEKERDALVAGLNEVRVSTKDGHLKLEAQLREKSTKVLELEHNLRSERTTFKERREVAKFKY